MHQKSKEMFCVLGLPIGCLLGTRCRSCWCSFAYTHYIYIYIQREREREITHVCVYTYTYIYIYIYRERERELDIHTVARVLQDMRRLYIRTAPASYMIICIALVIS